MPDKASSTAPAALTLPQDALAPDLVALFLGATPHPDIAIPEPAVTVAGLAAAARAGGLAGAGLRWDAARQRFAS
jgi:hypothetical protein